MMEYIFQMFGISLLLTLGIELVVLFLLKEGRKKNVVLLLLVNILTNPAAVFTAWLGDVYWGLGNKIWFQIPIEILVILVEAGVYYMFSKEKDWVIKHPIRLAVWANAVSWTSGLLIQCLI